ncbi:uncharacterized protein LY89DRAFT_506245 [Mollisia scopiformis]|uniref:Uncharacterized protein n=1 Tax=Mollisia scopiformis TaxID=149040 RepID=A0A194XGF0_MOLSC|nr:uncharacterized protein LY89DRAFT_506245 [Mollisia scopiformis]KUJ18852.1 hypothetical protein LY89DRAFT_506245 [Mollisia scopiformis]
MSETKMRRLAISMKEFNVYKHELSSLALDGIMIYLAPGIKNWDEGRVGKYGLPRGCECGCCDKVPPSKFAITLEDRKKCHKATASAAKRRVALEKGNNSFIPRVPKAQYDDTVDTVHETAQELFDQFKDSKWKVSGGPKFTVKILEIDKSVQYDAYEAKRAT